MTSIPVEIWWICSNNFKRHYRKNKRIFCAIFIAFIKPTLNLEHFWSKKCESYSFSIPQIIDSEGGGYLNVQNALLQNTFRQ